MHRQLADVVEDLERARARLHRLADAMPAERWARRADPARWSVAECVAHLNLTSRAYLPIVRAGLGEAAALGVPAPARYRRDPAGWLLAHLVGPLPTLGSVRIGRVRTPASFVPTGDQPRDVVLRDFDALQDELIACVRAADGRAIDRVRVTSPFDARARYNLYACLTLLAPHQHRHAQQAEAVWRGAAA
ncbi:MAG: DinB family protein [Gemmatirosa sp.]